MKAALSMLNKMKNTLRLPLVPMADAHSGVVRAALKIAGVLS